MIRRETGKIYLPESECPIGPELTRESFLVSSLSQGAKIGVQNEPWCSYCLAPVGVAGTRFYIMLYFHSQKLERVTLTDAHPRFGTSWADVTEEKMTQQKEQNDTWLKVWNLLPALYSWGRVENSVDLHNMESSIIFSYR